MMPSMKGEVFIEGWGVQEDGVETFSLEIIHGNEEFSGQWSRIVSIKIGNSVSYVYYVF